MERKYDWDQLEDLPELTWIPDRYDIEDKILFRSPLYLINHLMWNQLTDYKFYNQVNTIGDSIITVHGYYTASVHHLHRLRTILIPANTRIDETIVVNNYSRLREDSKREVRIENCFTEKNSESIRTYIEQLHRISDINEYCSPEMKQVVVKTPQNVVPYDRVMAVWAIDLILGLYREDNQGVISLVGCSDYLVDFSTQVYPKSNSYWIDRLRNEMVTNRGAYTSDEERTFSCIYAPDPERDSDIGSDTTYLNRLNEREN